MIQSYKLFCIFGRVCSLLARSEHSADYFVKHKNMKKLLALFLTFTVMTLSSNATDTKRIRLNAPQTDRGLAVMQAFKNRHSERQWADSLVTMQDLSDLLWAADGVNRPDGKRTAPSAMGKNDVDIYVFTPEDVYLYIPDGHELQFVASGDNRAMVVGGQPGFETLPPLALVYASTPSRFGIADTQAADILGYIDGGMVSENVGVCCAGLGLVNVPRYSMDREAIAKLLGLPEGTLLVLNDLVGYPAKH